MALPPSPLIPGLTGPVRRPSPQTPLPAPTATAGYQTYKFTPPPGQLLKFAPGRGYYAALAPPPALGAYQSPGALYGGDLGEPKPGPFPGFMTPQQMFDQAKKMADLSFGPVLQEAYRQQRQLHESNAAQLAGIQAAYQAIGVDPKSAIGVASYNKAVAEAQASESDFAGKLVDLVAQEGQAQAGYLTDLQKQQAGLYGDFQAQHKLSYHFGKDGEIVALDPLGNLQVIRKGSGPGPEKLTSKVVNGQVVWFDSAGNAVNKYGVETKPAGPNLVFHVIKGHWWGIDPKDGTKKTDLGPAPSGESGKPAAPVYRQGADGRTYLIDPKTNTATPVAGFPSKTAANKKRVIYDPITHTPLTAEAIRGYEQDTLASIRDARVKGQTIKDVLATMPPNIPKEVAIPLIMRAYKIPTWAAEGVGSTAQTSQLRNMGIQRLHNIALFLGIPLEGTHSYVGQAGGKTGKTSPVNLTGGYTKQELIGLIEQHLPKAEPAAETAAAGSRWPLPTQFSKIIGRPYQGSHTLYGNWQSDNAYDIAVPVGTPVYALADGTIGPHVGPFNSSDPHLGGSRVTVQGSDNAFYYAHLSKLTVTPGEHVKAGQLIGYSGSANGVAHLHIASENGDLMKYMKPQTGGPARQLASAGDSTTPKGAQKYAYSVATKKYGWGSGELAALRQLWQRESGWKYKSKNSGSGALGIPQALGHELPPGYADDPQVQINWGLKYIKDTYGSPTRAWAFWRATVNRNANTAPPDLRAKALYWIGKGYQGY